MSAQAAPAEALPRRVMAMGLPGTGVLTPAVGPGWRPDHPELVARLAEPAPKATQARPGKRAVGCRSAGRIQVIPGGSPARSGSPYLKNHSSRVRVRRRPFYSRVAALISVKSFFRGEGTTGVILFRKVWFHWVFGSMVDALAAGFRPRES